MAGIARFAGHTDAATYESHAEAMSRAVLQHGWDGEWFLRAYDRLGAKVGSHECDEGRIYIEPQGLCVMAGIGIDEGRAGQALDAVAERLATPHGIVLHQPAYTRYYLNLGEISSYPPGYKENAGIFCHTNPWIEIAEACLGRGDAAFDYYRRINPSVREAISDVHRCEPYVYAQMIAGRDAATYGEAKNSWLTGTAAWNLVAVTQWILGIRPTFERPADRAGHPARLARLPRPAGFPRRHLRHRRGARRSRQRRLPGGRRAAGRRRRRAPARWRWAHRGQGHAAVSELRA